MTAYCVLEHVCTSINKTPTKPAQCPDPQMFQPNVRPSNNRDHIDVLLSTEPSKTHDDMEYASQFKQNYFKNPRRMDWEERYKCGLADGYFKGYKNATTLKNTFNEVIGKRSKKKQYVLFPSSSLLPTFSFSPFNIPYPQFISSCYYTILFLNVFICSDDDETRMNLDK